MTPNILENISTWLVDWSLVTIMGNTTPPRDPKDENDEDDEDASTLRTSDWEIPNCLAIRVGVIPALKVARTALTWPCVNATFGSSGCRRSGDSSVVVD